MRRSPSRRSVWQGSAWQASALQRDQGTVAPLFMVIIWLTLLIGVLFFQTGRASDLGAEAQTGSDAAALAGAEDIRLQILEWMASGGFSRGPFVLNQPRAFAASSRYAAINSTRMIDFSIRREGYLQYRVSVETTTYRRLPDAGFDSTGVDGVGDAEFSVGNSERGRQSAAAVVRIGPSVFLSEGGFWSSTTGEGHFVADQTASAGVLPQGGGGSAVGTTTSGGCAIGRSELNSLAAEAGVTEEFAGRSALARYSDCDGGVSVAPLTRPMKISLLRLENAMNEPLNLNSAYRSPAYQAQLCERVNGPCAPPGQSMHNFGLAVDVQNWRAATVAINLEPTIGLCQPLPSNDAVHFVHNSGRECGGSTGTSGGTSGISGPFSSLGGFGAQGLLSVRLVE
ncbi:pilus assembly protein TadG-related protein [Euzebya tangerina]|uniref:pilus assembly protein TadG-related protein n=1 Tax=Euzebya tangerina TaxID=591198 RepID=UPI000E3139C0|nr:pilus assembly protein TadG-related protein [Euzebya tangerina]